MDNEDLNAKEWPLDAAHLQTQVGILREAVKYAKETGYTQVTIEIDVLEVLLNNSKLNF
ncbi:hypothetical protein [Vibrio cyclitrophicus]|uniref:hypothetical protein n=1 Tax=Vibrio cyclitrophicus TaxID=47951 RepID=UPI0032E40264